MTALREIPVEQLRAGDRVLVSRRIGLRRVDDVLAYDTLGLETVDCFVVVYDAPGRGSSWEKRSGATGHVHAGTVRRSVCSLQPLRRGETVQVEHLHLVERST